MPDHCWGLSCWWAAKHHAQVPLMLDDSVGALTRSVYDSSASTAKSFAKLVPILHNLEAKTNQFSSSLNSHSFKYQNELIQSLMSAKRALAFSKQITNGSSDHSSSELINKIIVRLGKLQKHIVLSIKAKNEMADSINLESREISNLGRNVLSSCQKSFSVLSVSDKICANAKLMQTISKSAVDKAERNHLAAASPDIHEGVNQVSAIVGVAKKFVPIKPVNAILPKEMGPELEKAFSHANAALEHAQKALLFTGAARAREVVDCRDELRSVLDHEQNVLALKREVTDHEIALRIVPEQVRIDKIIQKELLPKLQKFKIVNDKILKVIDQNRSITIDERLTKKVTKQSYLPLVMIRRRDVLASFL